MQRISMFSCRQKIVDANWWWCDILNNKTGRCKPISSLLRNRAFDCACCTNVRHYKCMQRLESVWFHQLNTSFGCKWAGLRKNETSWVCVKQMGMFSCSNAMILFKFHDEPSNILHYNNLVQKNNVVLNTWRNNICCKI